MKILPPLEKLFTVTKRKISTKNSNKAMIAVARHTRWFTDRTAFFEAAPSGRQQYMPTLKVHLRLLERLCCCSAFKPFEFHSQ